MADVVQVVSQLAADAAQVGIGRQLTWARPVTPGRIVSRASSRELTLQFGHELRTLRPRADQAHVAAEHVPQLRQFIEMAGPQEAAEQGNARVAGHRPAGAGQRLAVMDHGAEFEDRERPAILADALLGVECGAARGQLDQQRGQDHQGQGENRQSHRGGIVEEAFAGQIPFVTGWLDSGPGQGFQGRRERPLVVRFTVSTGFRESFRCPRMVNAMIVPP